MAKRSFNKGDNLSRRLFKLLEISPNALFGIEAPQYVE